jgi:heme-degrading monooxygenase HmoA
MEIFPEIASENIQGYQSVQLFRRLADAEVEFVVILWFESLEPVRKFAGEDYEHAYAHPKARDVLSRFDDRSQHYEVRGKLDY